MGLINIKCDILNINTARKRDLNIEVSMFEKGLSSHLPTADDSAGFILICHSGTADFLYEDRRYRLKAMDIAITFPNDIYSISNASAEFSASWVSFDTVALEAAMQGLTVASLIDIAARPTYSLSEGDEYSEYMAYLKILAAKVVDQRSICRYERVLAQLRSLLLEILNNTVQNLNIDTSSPKHRSCLLDEFVNMVKANPDKREVAYYAEQLHISPKHLSAIVADGTGMNAKDFIDRAAVEAIQQLLRTTKLSVGQIAERLDFSGSGNLCRFFKANTGITISDYKRELNR